MFLLGFVDGRDHSKEKSTIKDNGIGQIGGFAE
jgi:hypothetical protein